MQAHARPPSFAHIRPASSADRSRLPRLLLPILLVFLPGITSARADFTIEGNLDQMTLEATDAGRGDILTGISKRFKVAVVNGVYDDTTVSGRFHGTLNEVLRAVMGGNGFAIAYEGDRPSRVTFAVGGASSTYVVRDKKAIGQKDGAKVREAGAKPAEKPDRPSATQESDEARARATQQAVRELEALLKAARSDIEQ